MNFVNLLSWFSRNNRIRDYGHGIDEIGMEKKINAFEMLSFLWQQNSYFDISTIVKETVLIENQTINRKNPIKWKS